MSRDRKSSRMMWLFILPAFIWGAVFGVTPLSATPMQDSFRGPIFTTTDQELIVEAQKLVQQGQYDPAIAKAKDALSRDDKLAAAYEIIGHAMALKGDLAGGLQQLNKAVQAAPDQGSAYTKIGEIHLVQNNAKAAKTFFQKAIQLDPNDKLAHQRLGILYESEHEVGKAIEEYELSLRGMSADHMGIKVDLGRLYNLTGAYQKTLDLLAGSITNESTDATAHIVMGNAHLGLKRVNDAIAEFKIAEKLDPNSELVQIPLGIAYRQQMNYAKALEAFSKAVKLKPEDPSAYFQAGETYLAVKIYYHAETCYKKAEQYSKTPLPIQKQRAKLYLEQRAPQKAIDLYAQIISSGKADLSTYDLLGSTYQLTGQIEQAKTTFQTMKQRYPDNGFVTYRMGLFYGYITDYPAAIKEFEVALSKAPNDPLVLKALSVAHGQNKDGEKAIRYAEKLMETKPDDPGNKVYLASLYQEGGFPDRARGLYEQALAASPKNALALNNLAIILAEQGQLKEAALKSKQAVDLAPDNGMNLDTHGWILFRLGEAQTAFQQLELANQKIPNNPEILYHIGAAAKALGKTDAAKESLLKALQLSNNFKYSDEAKKLLDTL